MKFKPAAALLAAALLLTSCDSLAGAMAVSAPLSSVNAEASAIYAETISGLPESAADTFEDPLPSIPDVEYDYHADDIFARGTITVNDTDFVIDEETLNKYFEVTLADVECSVSFYAVDLETGASFGYNADDKYRPACTIKAGLALYVCRQIALGNASFDDTMTYERKHYVAGSGQIRRLGYGAVLTVRELLTHMLYESDNIAYYMLSDMFGYDGYNEMMKELGCTNEIGEGNHWSLLSPHELGLVWMEIYRFKGQCEEGEFLWSLLTDNMYNELDFALNEYFRNGYEVVAHKSGWSETAFNDAGIVMAEHPYMIVVMTDCGIRTYGFLDTVIYVDKLLKKYHVWLDEQNTVETAQ